jgi:hypothetical protein
MANDYCQNGFDTSGRPVGVEGSAIGVGDSSNAVVRWVLNAATGRSFDEGYLDATITAYHFLFCAETLPSDRSHAELQEFNALVACLKRSLESPAGTSPDERRGGDGGQTDGVLTQVYIYRFRDDAAAVDARLLASYEKAREEQHKRVAFRPPFSVTQLPESAAVLFNHYHFRGAATIVDLVGESANRACLEYLPTKAAVKPSCVHPVCENRCAFSKADFGCIEKSIKDFRAWCDSRLLA